MVLFMEVIVNKKLKEATVFNKICDYLSLVLILASIVALASNLPNQVKIISFVVCFFGAIGLFFTCAANGLLLKIFMLDSWRELKKIAWPNRKEAMQFTWVVFLFVAVMSLILWGVDSIIGWILYTFIIGR